MSQGLSSRSRGIWARGGQKHFGNQPTSKKGTPQKWPEGQQAVF